MNECDALARVKAVSEAATDGDGWRVQLRWMDIDALVREVEAGRRVFQTGEHFLGQICSDVQRPGDYKAMEEFQAALMAYDAARKGPEPITQLENP